MPAIQKVPAGALDLFGLKGAGYAAQELSSQVQPFVDYLRLYTIQREAIGSSLTGIVSVYGFWGMTFEGTVPDRALWITSGGALIADTVLAAGTTYRLSPAIAGAYGRTIWCGPAMEITAGEAVCLPFPPLVVPAGSVFGVYASRVTLGTAQAFRCNIPYVQLDV